ncbi:hypothetical protein F7725_002013, partial [Dissostichus mawsoni]
MPCSDIIMLGEPPGPGWAICLPCIIPPGPPGDIIRCWGPIMPWPMNPGGRIELWPGLPIGMSWGPITPSGPPGIPPIPCMDIPILGGPPPIMPCMGKPEGCGCFPPGLSPPPRGKNAGRSRPHHLMKICFTEPTLHAAKLWPSRVIRLAHTPITPSPVRHVPHSSSHRSSISLESHWMARKTLWTRTVVRGERSLMGRGLREGVALASTGRCLDVTWSQMEPLMKEGLREGRYHLEDGRMREREREREDFSFS